MKLTETKIDGQVIYNGKVVSLVLDNVLLPDGSTSKREIVRHSGGAAVLFIKDNKVLLVKQFRYAYGKEMYEIPAGKLNDGEEPCVAAARELEEETGYKAELVHFMDICPTPGYTDEIIHIFYAENSTRSAQNLDEGEFLNVEFLPLDIVVEMIERGEISDAKTIIAIYRYLLKINNGGA